MSDTDYTDDTDQSDQEQQPQQYAAADDTPEQQTDQSQQPQIVYDTDLYNSLPPQSEQQQPQQNQAPIVYDTDLYNSLPPAPEDETSATGAAARAFARSALPVTGGILAGAAAGAAAGGGLGSIPVGVAAGFGTTAVLQGVENKIADTLGLSDPHALLGGEWGGFNPFNPKLQQEDEMQHATSVGLGNVASAIGALRGGNAGPIVRLMGAGIFGASEAASQYIQTGKVDWGVVAGGAAMGAAFPNVAGHRAPPAAGVAGEAGEAPPAATVGDVLKTAQTNATAPEAQPVQTEMGLQGQLYNEPPSYAAKQQDPQVQADRASIARAQDVENNSRGVAQENSPVQTIPGTGNDIGRPMQPGTGRLYPKETETAPVLTQGDIPPDQQSALEPNLFGEEQPKFPFTSNLQAGQPTPPRMPPPMPPGRAAPGPAAPPAEPQQLAPSTPPQPEPPIETGLAQRPASVSEAPAAAGPEAPREPAPDTTGLAEATRTVPTAAKGDALQGDLDIPDFLRVQPGERAPAATEAPAAPAEQPYRRGPVLSPKDQAAADQILAQQAADKKTKAATKGLDRPGVNPTDQAAQEAGMQWNARKAKWEPGDLSISATPKPLSADASPGDRVRLIGGVRGAWGDLKNSSAWFDNPIRKIFSPQSVSANAEEAAGITRMTHGQQEQFDAQNQTKLEAAQRVMNQAPAKDVMDYLTNFEKNTVPHGNVLATVQPDVKGVLDRFKTELQKLPEGDQIGFIDNYFPRSKLWADDDANMDRMHSFLTGQGSTSPLKARQFPTIQDALNAGVKFNPDMLRPDGAPDMMKVLGTYMRQMNNYIEAQTMLGRYVKEGLAHVYTDGDTPRSGELRLEGRTYRGLPVYSTPDVATIFNNYWSPGIHSDAAAGQLFDAWMHGKNMISALKLLGGGYHLAAVGTESVIGRASIGLSQMVNGDFAKGLANIAKSPVAPVTSYRLGKVGMGEYLNPGSHPELAEAVSALKDAGMSMTPQQLLAQNPELQTVDPHSAANNFFTAFDRGRMALDMAEAKQRVRTAADKNLAVGAGQVGKEAFNIVGKAMQTIMYPLFNHYIPLLKNGLAIQHIAAWREAHPDAPYADMVAAARKVSDQTDNILGMINQSNVFWNKTLKQSVQAAMLSWGWNFGTARGLGGGALKLMRNPTSVGIGSRDWDPRSAYVITMPIITTVMASIYQLMKTGKMPEEPPNGIGNAFTGETGGKVPHGSQPERAILPGYQKDVLGVWNNVLNPKGTGKATAEIYNKLAPAIQMGVEGLTNQDWAGHPIWNPNHPMSQKLLEYFQHVGQSLLPITADQALQQRGGTNITVPERLMGVRAAPSWVEKPDATQKSYERRSQKAWDEGQRFNRWMAQ